MQIHRLYLKVPGPAPGLARVPREYAWTKDLARRYVTAAARLAARNGSISLLLPWRIAGSIDTFASVREVEHLQRASRLIEALPSRSPARAAVENLVMLRASGSKPTTRASDWNEDGYQIALTGALTMIADSLANGRVPIAILADLESGDAH